MSVLENEQPRRRGTEPRARRPRRKRSYKAAADRRAEILDCALTAFAEHGYHQTSIADVCERAAIGRATLYQYFSDKRDLLQALAEQIATRIVAAFENRPFLRIPEGFVPTEEQAIAFMEARFTTVLEVVFENADTARLVLRAGRGADGVVDAMLQRIDRAMLERIEADLTRAKEAGVIRPVDVGFVARFFMGGIEKIVLSCLEENRPFDVRMIAREAATLEASGILLHR